MIQVLLTIEWEQFNTLKLLILYTSIVIKYLQSTKHSIDFAMFFVHIQRNLRNITTIAKNAKDEIKIFGGKANIYTHEYGVWQFRVWLSNENKCVRKSLRTKAKIYVIEQAEKLYIKIRNESN